MSKGVVGYLCLGTIASGAIGIWATFSSLNGTATDGVVGVAAVVAFMLSAAALFRRSWTRLPLALTCAIAGALIYSAFIEPDEPSAIDGPAYFFYNSLLIVIGSVTLISSRLTSERKSPAATTSPTHRTA